MSSKWYYKRKLYRFYKKSDNEIIETTSMIAK